MKLATYAVLTSLIIAAIASAQPAAVLEQEAARVSVVAKVKPAVVAIFARGGQGGGTGVLISDDGFALTNFHVVQPTGPTMQCGLADGVLYDGVLVGWDKVGDVALIKLLPKKAGQKFPFAEMGNSDLVKQGDWSIAMGNPFLVATDFTPTVTFGLVSGVNRYQPPAGVILEYTDCIQIDTSINPGNSGGPLFNLKGEIIGINGRGSFDKRGRINSGVGYAISINQIKNFMGHLHAGLDADHASLGALVRTEAEGNGIGKTRVTTILEECDAFRRGLETDDEIFSFAGRTISSDNHYKNIVGIFPRGWRVPLEYRRGDDKKEVLVRLMGVQKKELPDGPPGLPKDDPKQPMPKAKGPQGEGAKYFEPKAGYANYYFNKEEKNRLLANFKRAGDFGAMLGTWTVEGEARIKNQPVKNKFTIDITEAKDGKATVAMTLGAFPEVIEPRGDKVGDFRRPQGSGGFLAAMYLWRHLLTLGEKGFPSDCTHGGMEPFYAPPTDNSLVKNWSAQRVDAEVLNSSSGIYKLKWFFENNDPNRDPYKKLAGKKLVSPTESKLLGFELRQQDLNEDPCEVYFSDYRPVGGKQLPHAIQVYYRDAHYGTFTISDYKLAAN